MQQRILNELHECHMGIVRTKAMARNYVWWPRLDLDIEQLVRSCRICIEFQNNPPKATLNTWEWPSKPNYRLHADFAGPIGNFVYLIILDAHSKWVEVAQMRSKTSAKVIVVFKNYIAQWGLPHYLVTDNDPSFDSEEFQKFLKINGIK